MSVNKKATILHCEFEKEWENPKSGNKIFYHQLVLDNGDVGAVGTVEKNSKRIKKGATIEYEWDETKKKIRVNKSSNDPSAIAEKVLEQKSKSSANKYNSFKIRQQDEFLGFVWGYAKDLLIAGKTMDEIKKMPEIAQYLYDEVGKMLKATHEAALPPFTPIEVPKKEIQDTGEFVSSVDELNEKKNSEDSDKEKAKSTKEKKYFPDEYETKEDFLRAISEKIKVDPKPNKPTSLWDDIMNDEV